MGVNTSRLLIAGSLLIAFALALPACGNDNNSDSNRAAYSASTGQECAGVENCTSETKPMETLAAGARTEFTYTCSSTNPYLQNWDVAQHRYITLSAVSFTPDSITLVAKNLGSGPGNFDVSLGCATQPATRLDFMVSSGYRPF
jgi:hypothetical protein